MIRVFRRPLVAEKDGEREDVGHARRDVGMDRIVVDRQAVAVQPAEAPGGKAGPARERQQALFLGHEVMGSARSEAVCHGDAYSDRMTGCPDNAAW